jgi:riboflavin kinase / FMN adenylyltransferase
MRVFRGLRHPGLLRPCALTIGNFDGVHRGHQAMLALLINEARHRGVPSAVLTFEPHPRDFFAMRAGKPEAAPARVATLRDKLAELERCGIEQTVVLPFDDALASHTPAAFVEDVLVAGFGARYVLVGDDFRFGAKRAGDYAMLDAAGAVHGFDVARMQSYEVHGLRVSSSAVREALATGDMARATALLGRPYSISGHVLHGAKLGRELGFRTLNLRFAHPRPAAAGIFVVRVQGLTGSPLRGVASLGRRPTVDDSGRMLLETHVLDWPAALGSDGGYGRLVRVELLHWLHEERRYASLEALRQGIAADTAAARAWWQRQPGADRLTP